MPQLSNVNWNFSFMMMIVSLFLMNFFIHFIPIMFSYDSVNDINSFYKSLMKI